WNYDDAITDLVVWAQAYYPELAQQLYQETGIDPEFYPTGLYMLDSAEHNKALAWAQRTQADLVNVDIADVYHKAPQLGSGFHQALAMPTVGNIRNPRLLQALIASLKRSPRFRLLPDESVQSIELNGHHLVGVRTAQQVYQADKVLVAAGAWSPLLVESCHIPLAIEPVRGEMLIFEPCPGLLTTMVLHDGKYLIPRKDGRIVVGSTTEQEGYHKITTEAGYRTLLAAAHRLLPRLETMAIEKHWAGLRPGAPAGLPYMGESQDISGLFVCAGHYRNGLVTAPASARLMADLILNRPSVIAAEPFRLDRPRINAEMF
ncbi:MAG: glycine oxidase ThiO, partial [Gammaproteobacteria bacterium]